MAKKPKSSEIRSGSASARGTETKGAKPSAPRKSWMQTHGRDLKFLVVFAVLMSVYYLAETTHAVNDRFFPWYLRQTAAVSYQVLKTAGFEDVKIEDKSLSGKQGSITVERGCDAVAPTVLFMAAVIASPAAWRLKVPAVFGGFLILMCINVVRIISLFLTRIYWPGAFDVMHLDVWQAAFIFFAIFLWAAWASWAARRRRAPPVSHAAV